MLSLDRKLALLSVRLDVSIAEHSAGDTGGELILVLFLLRSLESIHFTETAFSRFRITSTQINISILKPGRGSA